MHRFGRSDRKWTDRWGGGFIIAAVLALVGAWWVGTWLGDGAGPPPPEMPATTYDDLGPSEAAVEAPQADLMGYPRPLTVYLLQEGAYSTRDRAQRRAADLKTQGIPAQVTEQGGLHKVVIGAYGSAEAAKAAKSQWQAKVAELWPSRLDITSLPPLPTAPEADAAYEDGLATLNAYLHEAAAFWDGYAVGVPVNNVDTLAAHSNRLSEIAGQLRLHQADMAVNHFLALADLAVANSAQMSGLSASASTGNSPDYQAAMNGYLSLLESYRAWSEGV